MNRAEVAFIKLLIEQNKKHIEEGFTLYDKYFPLDNGTHICINFNENKKLRLKIYYGMRMHSPAKFGEILTLAAAIYGDKKHQLNLDNPKTNENFLYTFLEQ